MSPAEAAALTALAGSPSGLGVRELIERLTDAGVEHEEAQTAVLSLLEKEQIAPRSGNLELTSPGAHALLDLHAALEQALDPSPSTPGMEDCPSVPWLTTVQTHWIDAVSLNYAVDTETLRALLPRPLEPEVFHGTSWVQVLASRLREMRPQGMPSLFGVSFHQVSYRAAVNYRNRDGELRRGGYFLRSETDHAVMRAVGNTLTEFRFHDFGAAQIELLHEGPRLSFSVTPENTPEKEVPYGRIRAALDTSQNSVPEGSVWSSLAELREPLVVCCDAFGIDPEGWVYVLTIDREPWRERYASVLSCEAEYFSHGPLGRGASRLDSALHVPHPCGYRWRPLRRERFVP